MIPTLPAASTTAVVLPKDAEALDAKAIFQLGRLGASYENRAWGREKVRQAHANLKRTIEEELHGGDSTDMARDQLRDREQVLVSLERFYKKLRHETADRFPHALGAMEQMIPGSTKGLVPSNARSTAPDLSP